MFNILLFYLCPNTIMSLLLLSKSNLYMDELCGGWLFRYVNQIKYSLRNNYIQSII